MLWNIRQMEAEESLRDREQLQHLIFNRQAMAAADREQRLTPTILNTEAVASTFMAGLSQTELACGLFQAAFAVDRKQINVTDEGSVRIHFY